MSYTAFYLYFMAIASPILMKILPDTIQRCSLTNVFSACALLSLAFADLPHPG